MEPYHLAYNYKALSRATCSNLFESIMSEIEKFLPRDHSLASRGMLSDDKQSSLWSHE